VNGGSEYRGKGFHVGENALEMKVRKCWGNWTGAERIKFYPLRQRGRTESRLAVFRHPFITTQRC
jgi:hypothetical protein